MLVGVVQSSIHDEWVDALVITRSLSCFLLCCKTGCFEVGMGRFPLRSRQRILFSTAAFTASGREKSFI
jgi:hypothetical protein